MLCVAIVLASCWSPGNHQTRPGQARQPTLAATPPSHSRERGEGGSSLLSVQLSFIITLVHSCCCSSSSSSLSWQLIEKSAAHKVFGKFARPPPHPLCRTPLPLPLLSLSLSLTFRVALFCRFCTLPFPESVFHNLACRSAQFSHIIPPFSHSPYATVPAVDNPFAQGGNTHTQF